MAKHMSRAKNTVIFDATDRHATRVKLTERLVSEWQRELRLEVTGEMVGHPGVTHRRSVTIKKPAELADLALKLNEFLTSPGTVRISLALKPHKRLVGSLWRDSDTSIWDLQKAHRVAHGVRIDDALLTDLKQTAEEIAESHE